jgi:transcriptional regulator with XRE-family HTH domain
MAFDLLDLGKNIRKLRLSKLSRIKSGRPLLQYELAEIAGIPASSLCNIEKGKYTNPTWEMLSKIAFGLDCDISDFFNKDAPAVSPSRIALTEMIDIIVKERLEKLLKDTVGKP